MLACPIKNTQLEQSSSELGRMNSFRLFTELGKVPFAEATRQNTAAVRHFKPVLHKLSQLTGKKYNLVSTEEMVDLSGFEEPPIGLFKDDEVFLDQSRMSLESLFHEFGHPIIDHMDSVDPGSIDRLYEEVLKYPQGKELLRQLEQNEFYKSLGYFGATGIIKPGVSELFKENPELSKIGSMEEYSRYLDTIFPDSKVQDIVYHGSDKPLVLRNKLLPSERSFQKEFQIEDGIFFSRIKDGEAFSADEYGDVHTYVKLNVKKPELGTYYNTKIGKRTKESDAIFGSHIGLGKEDVIEEALKRANTTYEKEQSGFHLWSNIIAVFESDQIHILGSKQDLEGFRKFVKSQKQEINKDGKKELIVQLLGKLAEDSYEKNLDKSLFKTLLDFVKKSWNRLLKSLGLRDELPVDFSKLRLGDLVSLMTFESRDSLGVELQTFEEPRYFNGKILDGHEKLFQEIQLYLNKRLQDMSRSTKGSLKKRKLENFIEKWVEEKGRVEKLAFLTDFAYKQISGENGMLESLNKLIDNIKNSPGKESALDILTQMQEFKSFASDFSHMFRQIQGTLIEEMGNPNYSKEAVEPGSVIWKIEEILRAATNIDRLQKQYFNLALASVLYPYYSKETNETARKNLTDLIQSYSKRRFAIEQEYKKQNKDPQTSFVYRDLSNEIVKLKNQLKKFHPDFNSFYEQITMAIEDISDWDFRTTSAKSSSDPILSSFAKMIKIAFESMRIKLQELQTEARGKLDKFRKQSNRNLDFAESFYEGMYETIKIFHEGSFMEVVSFINEADLTAYNLEKSEMISKVKLLRSQMKMDEAKDVEEAFYSKSREKLSDEEIDRMIEDYQKLVNEGKASIEEFHYMITRNIYNKGIFVEVDERYRESNMDITERNKILAERYLELHKTRSKTLTYKKGFTKVNHKRYPNKNYQALQANKPVKELHDYMLGIYLDAQKLLPPSQRNGYMVPQVRKRGWERMATGQVYDYVKEEIKDIFSFIEEDEVEYGNQAIHAKYEKKFLPIYYTNPLDVKHTSVNLMKNVLLFAKMANKFHEMDSIKEVTEAMINVSENREVGELTSTGEGIFDKLAASFGYKKQKVKAPKDANVNKAIAAFVDMQVFGENKKLETFTLAGYEINLGKFTDFITKWASRMTLGADFLKAVANMTQAKLMEIVESSGGEFIDRNSFLEAEKVYYTQVLPDVGSDFGKGVPQSFWGKLIEAYDPIQGDWENSYGQQISNTKFLRSFSLDALFMGMHAGEHYAQVTMMLGVLAKQKVKVNGKEISLLKAYIPGKDNVPVLMDGVDPEWSIGGKKMIDLVNKIHAINNRLHGVYNSFDAPEIQRHAIGRLMMMFRKFAPPGIKKRYKRFGVNQQTETVDEGFYVTFFNALMRQRSDLWKYISGKENALLEFQKANINRFFSEAALIALTGLGIFASSGWDEDNEDNYAARFTEYQMRRLNSELMFYFSPKDFLKIMKSPSAATSKVMQGWKAIEYTFLTWDPEELYYKRKTGKWNKGDSKTWAAWMKLLGLNGFNMHPNEAIKSFQLSLQ